MYAQIYTCMSLHDTGDVGPLGRGRERVDVQDGLAAAALLRTRPAYAEHSPAAPPSVGGRARLADALPLRALRRGDARGRGALGAAVWLWVCVGVCGCGYGCGCGCGCGYVWVCVGVCGCVCVCVCVSIYLSVYLSRYVYMYIYRYIYNMYIYIYR